MRFKIQGKLTRSESGTARPLPSKLAMAQNFGRALMAEASAIARRVPAVTEEEQARRKAICEGCAKYRPEDGRCSLCGCPKNRKVAWRSQRCPKLLWGVSKRLDGLPR
jgi:hypothetical protein